MRCEEIGAWLLSRELGRGEHVRGEHDGEQRRFARATVTFFGWLPLAIIMFWMSFILTKGIAFVNDADVRAYKISAVGSGAKPVLVDIFGNPGRLRLMLAIPLGTAEIFIDHVAPGDACRWANSPDKSLTNASMSYFPMRRPYGTLFGRRVTIRIPSRSAVYNVDETYGNYGKFVYVECATEWQPEHESFTEYRLKVKNGETDDALAGAAAAPNRLPVIVNVADLDDSKLLTLAGKATAQQDERLLIPGDAATADWRPENGAETRDVLFIVIGAFIALGAALLIEGLRPHVELAIETNYADAPRETV